MRYITNRLLVAILIIAGSTGSLMAQSKKKVPSGLYMVVKKSAYAFKDSASNKIVYINPAPVISVSQIEKVTTVIEAQQLPALSLVLDATGTRKLSKVTTRMTGKRMAVIINNHLLAAPLIREPIKGGQLMITGTTTAAEAENFKRLLQKEMDAAKVIKH
ncbi:hypothetical protein CLV51_102866 [Chitinophaga niastensis]|uniref:SecDF P1 head subdomain domain-containing protein n=1 Tax=Chitinophaga niastensis TaxID=536980 RepID=A0A2P8HP61_CHINA|nr:hypothetical protein [Chitinophaga niastensis]PSL48006.1 hypothetical protein CLV51_102866 [Chitinophaga niastensis]